MSNIEIDGGGTTPAAVLGRGDGPTGPAIGPYMLSGVSPAPESAPPPLLDSSLLQHNSLAVNLNGAAELMAVNYRATDALFPADLTEEDRRLAEALVAVQLGHNAQHQQQTSKTITMPTSLDQQVVLPDNNTVYIHQNPAPLSSAAVQPPTKLLSTSIKTEKNEKMKHHKTDINTTSINAKRITDKKGHSLTVDGGKTTPLPPLPPLQPSLLPHKKRISPHSKAQKTMPTILSGYRPIAPGPAPSPKFKPAPPPTAPPSLLKPKIRKVFVCNRCQLGFNSREDLVRHAPHCQEITPTGTAQSSLSFSCQICDEPFVNQLSFFSHLKSHYEPSAAAPSIEQPTFKCNYCRRKYRRLKMLETHVKMHHPQQLRSTESRVSGTTVAPTTTNTTVNSEFSDPEDMLEGINVVVNDCEEATTNNDEDGDDDDSDAHGAGAEDHNDDEDSKEVENDDHVSVKKEPWYREEDLHQTEEDLKELEEDEKKLVVEKKDMNTFRCPACKRVFGSKTALSVHDLHCQRLESQGRNVLAKPPHRVELPCPQCDRVFVHRNSLLYHIRGHSGIRPHQCDECGKSFFSTSALKVHQRLHTGDRPYHCEVCGRQFRQWGDLKYHTASLHTPEKQFQCEYCGKEFARKYSLIIHRRIHTGEKNYKCDFCEKTFRASSYMRIHRQIHTGEKPHKCETCGKGFRARSDMRRHEKTHTDRRGQKGASRTRSKTAGHTNNTVPPVTSSSVATSQLPPTSPNNALSTLLLKTKVENDDMIDQDDDDDNESETPADLIADQDLLSTYEEDPLATTTSPGAGRENSTLYSNGHQLFLVSYSADVKDVDTSAWIHTNS